MDLLLVVKLIVLSYIVVSPFINNQWLFPLHSLAFKIMLLVLIIAVSFIDLQLAVLLMVAFLIMIINLNKNDITKLSKQESTYAPSFKEHMVRGLSVYPMPSDIEQHSIESERSISEDFTQQQAPPKISQTMYQFPAPYCKGVAHVDPYQISDNAFLYSTDDRTKPYEEYIRTLSPDTSLENIQTNVIDSS